MKKNKKVVTLGGGTGQYHLLLGLKEIPKIDITAIVTMADYGGSSGRLRDAFGALPPGDVLRCLLALSMLPGEEARKLLLRRFELEGVLKGHNAGNLLLTLLHQYSGSFLEAIRAMEEILEVKGHVLPVTVGNITLHGSSMSGKKVHHEADFDRLDEILGSKERIMKVWLDPNALMLLDVGKAIGEADIVIIVPGDLFSSIALLLLVQGVREVIKQSKARFIYVCNIMTKRGQTDEFSVTDFVRMVEHYLKRKVDYVICHTGKLDEKRKEKYRLEKAQPVQPDFQGFLKEDRQIIKTDLMAKGKLARHDPQKLTAVLKTIILS